MYSNLPLIMEFRRLQLAGCFFSLFKQNNLETIRNWIKWLVYLISVGIYLLCQISEMHILQHACSLLREIMLWDDNNNSAIRNKSKNASGYRFLKFLMYAVLFCSGKTHERHITFVSKLLKSLFFAFNKYKFVESYSLLSQLFGNRDFKFIKALRCYRGICIFWP